MTQTIRQRSVLHTECHRVVLDDGTDDEWQGKRDGSAIVAALWYALGLALLCSLMFLPALGEPVDWTPAPEFHTDAQRHYDVWVSLKDVQP